MRWKEKKISNHKTKFDFCKLKTVLYQYIITWKLISHLAVKIRVTNIYDFQYIKLLPTKPSHQFQITNMTRWTVITYPDPNTIFRVLVHSLPSNKCKKHNEWKESLKIQGILRHIKSIIGPNSFSTQSISWLSNTNLKLISKW